MTDRPNETRPPVNRPERSPIDRGGKLLVPQKTPEKSPFQKVLDETSQRSDFSPRLGQATETREAVKSVLSQQERYGRDRDQFERRMRERDREEGRRGDSRESGDAKAKVAEKRVTARSSTGEKKHQGEGEGSGGGGGQAGREQGRKGKWLAAGAALKGIRQGEKGEAKGGAFNLEMQSMTSSTAAAAKPKEANILTKALLDQIVQYCRLVTKTDGDKEFDVQLHEEVFKGLRLKIAMVKGKIEATFITHSEQTRDLFQAQKSEIQQALAEKGIDVRAVNVIMI